MNYGLSLNPARAKKIGPLITVLTRSILILPFTEKTGNNAADVRAVLKQKRYLDVINSRIPILVKRPTVMKVYV